MELLLLVGGLIAAATLGYFFVASPNSRFFVPRFLEERLRAFADSDPGMNYVPAVGDTYPSIRGAFKQHLIEVSVEQRQALTRGDRKSVTPSFIATVRLQFIDNVPDAVVFSLEQDASLRTEEQMVQVFDPKESPRPFYYTIPEQNAPNIRAWYDDGTIHRLGELLIRGRYELRGQTLVFERDLGHDFATRIRHELDELIIESDRFSWRDLNEPLALSDDLSRS